MSLMNQDTYQNIYLTVFLIDLSNYELLLDMLMLVLTLQNNVLLLIKNNIISLPLILKQPTD